MDNNPGTAKFIVKPDGTIYKNYGSTQQVQPQLIRRVSEEKDSNSLCCSCSCTQEQKSNCYKLMFLSCCFMGVTHHDLSGGH